MGQESTRLRLLNAQDAGALAQLAVANAEHLRPWDPVRPPAYLTVEGQSRVVARLLEQHGAGAGVPFAIIDAQGTILGRITISGIVRGAMQSCSIGYWIRADRLREGHATRAVAQAVAHAFGELKLHRVQAETLPENAGSQEVLRRNGFIRYGLAPKYLRINGAWRDHVMFQLLNPAGE
ncbi:GNAT family N-acetyltransferase [Microbacterium terrisoli]|jgi:ribosomal-protein-alanine N-acetyltransferase|uniref:GNAT family N-acetyltransferase n=1 Tax=Microbacterium terrisoli TaxID=3242192 RepID=UPI0028057975|nr:GNAT family protein [Microbacterium protaetiae]